MSAVGTRPHCCLQNFPLNTTDEEFDIINPENPDASAIYIQHVQLNIRAPIYKIVDF